jgi:hypothetical protein
VLSAIGRDAPQLLVMDDRSQGCTATGAVVCRPDTALLHIPVRDKESLNEEHARIDGCETRFITLHAR